MKKLCIVLCLCLILLCACSNQASQTPTPTPEPAATSAPIAGESSLQGALNALQEAQKSQLEYLDGVLSAREDAYAARIPLENQQSLIAAVGQAQDVVWSDGDYVFSFSSGGNFRYEKPYADITYGVNTDIYVVSDDGELEETNEVLFYDPLTYVLSGEGGGEFAYASRYLLASGGNSGSFETVSSLDSVITGWSHYEFSISDGTLAFADAQLSLSANQTAAPYTWVICVGLVTKNSAEIMEFTAQTVDLSLPNAYPLIATLGTSGVNACISSHGHEATFRLTAKGSDIQAEN